VLINIPFYLLIRYKTLNIHVDCVGWDNESADGFIALVSKVECVVFEGVERDFQLQSTRHRMVHVTFFWTRNTFTILALNLI
jgi:hypothetical protein